MDEWELYDQLPPILRDLIKYSATNGEGDVTSVWRVWRGGANLYQVAVGMARVNLKEYNELPPEFIEVLRRNGILWENMQTTT